MHFLNKIHTNIESNVHSINIKFFMRFFFQMDALHVDLCPIANNSMVKKSLEYQNEKKEQKNCKGKSVFLFLFQFHNMLKGYHLEKNAISAAKKRKKWSKFHFTETRRSELVLHVQVLQVRNYGNLLMLKMLDFVDFHHNFFLYWTLTMNKAI